jgi:preprotein translocase subunit Sec63
VGARAPTVRFARSLAARRTLLYAHLLREKVPPGLQPDMDFVLQHTHHLLNGLLNITMEQRFVASTMNVIECSQLLTQALWFHSNQLLQLPHVDQTQIKQLNKVRRRHAN